MLTDLWIGTEYEYIRAWQEAISLRNAKEPPQGDKTMNEFKATETFAERWNVVFGSNTAYLYIKTDLGKEEAQTLAAKLNEVLATGTLVSLPRFEVKRSNVRSDNFDLWFGNVVAFYSFPTLESANAKAKILNDELDKEYQNPGVTEPPPSPHRFVCRKTEDGYWEMYFDAIWLDSFDLQEDAVLKCEELNAKLLEPSPGEPPMPVINIPTNESAVVTGGKTSRTTKMIAIVPTQATEVKKSNRPLFSTDATMTFEVPKPTKKQRLLNGLKYLLFGILGSLIANHHPDLSEAKDYAASAWQWLQEIEWSSVATEWWIAGGVAVWYLLALLVVRRKGGITNPDWPISDIIFEGICHIALFPKLGSRTIGAAFVTWLFSPILATTATASWTVYGIWKLMAFLFVSFVRHGLGAKE